MFKKKFCVLVLWTKVDSNFGSYTVHRLDLRVLKFLLFHPFWRVFVLLKIQATLLLLYTYLFDGCYFEAIMGSVKIAKIKYL